MTSQTTPFLAEVAEADAPAPIHLIYQQIREKSGVPMAALIFRHLATLPGVLEEAWAVLSPLMTYGMIQDRTWSLAKATALQPLDLLSPLARRAVGVSGESFHAVWNVFAAYNRANPVNHLCLLTLMHRLRSKHATAPERPPIRFWYPPAPIGELPPMTPPEAMPPVLTQLVASMSCGPQLSKPAVPSLYRHLVAWPGLLAIFQVMLAPRFADGSIARAVADYSQQAEKEAADLARYLPALPRLAASAEAQRAMAHFSRLIPEMVVIGRLLDTALFTET